MPADLFREIGGFTRDYIIGDYEDSDLCLKIRAAGREIRYVPAAELYHLERQSIAVTPVIRAASPPNTTHGSSRPLVRPDGRPDETRLDGQRAFSSCFQSP